MSSSTEIVRPELAPFTPVFQHLRADSSRYFGVSRPTLRVERYMSRLYSDVAQLQISDGVTSCRAFVKIAKLRHGESREAMANRVKAVFDTMSWLHRSMAGSPGLSAVRPIACFPEHLAIVTEEVRGDTLRRLLESKAAWWPSPAITQQLTASLGRAGQWVRRFHDVHPPNGNRLDSAEMREYLDLRLRILTRNERLGFSESDRRRVLDAFKVRASRLTQDDLRPVPIHADFSPENVVVDGTNIAVLDFSIPATGTVYHDISHLYMQLGLLTAKPKFRPEVVGRLQAALLRGFDETLVPSHPVFELMYVQHTVCHLTGLAQNPAGPAARVYNWHLKRRHLRWLRALVARS